MSSSPATEDGLVSTEATSQPSMSQTDIDLQRKRARDRKSQQAMRDRHRDLVQNLNGQVAFLTNELNTRVNETGLLDSRIAALEAENAQLRAQNAALQLSLLNRGEHSGLPIFNNREPWETPPLNSQPSCIADHILQNFIASERTERASSPADTESGPLRLKPNPTSLLYKHQRTNDEVSNVAGDIVRSYSEIETFPKQVAVFYVMSILFKWLVFLDKSSWDTLPNWLRPIPCQLSLPHAAWVDRVPWPKAREYLVQHPEITLDDFASTYSSSFTVKWDFDPAHVLITVNSGGSGLKEVIINPVYEDEIRQLKNWAIGQRFRERFPEIAKLIDEEINTA
ncbi:hypothetical protein JX266_010196 [Neoarthrinium moseri]|nr:hypothetical protein JX266_010196 [Neoarthrinium moseri]